MTVREAKNKLIAWAEAQIGTREGANNYNRYARGMQKDRKSTRLNSIHAKTSRMPSSA